MAGLAEYTRTIAPGASDGIGVRGNFIRVKETSGQIEVTTRQDALGNKSGEQYKLPMKKFEKLYAASEFDKVEIRSLEATNDVTVVLQIGYGDFEAEIISRTQAAKFLSYSQQDESSLLAGSTFTLLPENLQRKRVIIQVTKPGPFLSLTPDNVTPKMTLDWDAAIFAGQDVSGYEVWKIEDPSGGVFSTTWADLLNDGTLVTTTAGNVLTYDDAAADPSTHQYVYGVRALTATGGKKRSNIASHSLS